MINYKYKISVVAPVYNEEGTVKELVGALDKKDDISKIKGIWYKNTLGGISQTEGRQAINDLDALTLPAWDLFPMDMYLKNPVGAPNRNKWIDGSGGQTAPLSMNLFATRGCPYRCIYCYHDFMGQKYRHRSAENVIEEIKILYERHKVPYFHFIDDEFVMDKDFVYKFCESIKSFSEDVGQRITWGCAGRVNLMTEELLASMAE